MKIKRLIVPEYKNVAVDVELHAGLITMLVGQNGMGKSNLLEVLLMIFDELYQLASGHKLSEDEKARCGYTLEYECRGLHYKAVKDKGELALWEEDPHLGDDMEFMLTKIPFEALPSQIIGYYSGENKRIRELVAKHIKREESSRRRKYSKRNINELEPKKLFFAENRHSKLVLATMLLYQEHPLYSENIKKVLRDIVHISSWDRIHVKFRNPSFAKMSQLKKQGRALSDYHNQLMQGDAPREKNIFWGIQGSVDMLLHLLLDYYIGGSKYSVQWADRGVREYFDVESIPADDDFKEMLFKRFPTPMDFLHTLEECFVLNMVDTFEIVLRKAGERSYYPYIQLSEGEQQYLAVMGLIALSHSSQDETLFLLDEPDTHINPLWQRNYIKQIKELSDMEADRQGKAFFVSTHSPLLVQANSSDDKDVDLLLFKKNEEGKIEIDTKDDDVMKNWRIDQVLMSKYFDLPSSRPASLDEFMARRRAVVEGTQDGDVKSEFQGKFVDGYLPTGETLADVEAMTFIHRMAEKLRKEGHL
ncbi:MAG: AAA family ATPase [Bacteroidaceae bacterium]|nr:AAA family ATPase [Bacteroidaceae bacterium]